MKFFNKFQSFVLLVALLLSAYALFNVVGSNNTAEADGGLIKGAIQTGVPNHPGCGYYRSTTICQQDWHVLLEDPNCDQRGYIKWEAFTFYQEHYTQGKYFDYNAKLGTMYMCSINAPAKPYTGCTKTCG